MVDVAIVGGGAAGIAAGRRLVGRNRSVILIEALPQIGGRARTVTMQGMPLDLGCGWLHSAERNPLAMLAEEQCLTLDRSGRTRRRQLGNIGLSAAEQLEARAAYNLLWERLRADPPASDCAGDGLPPDDRWRPFMDGISSFINGTELDQLSVADFIAYDDAASDANWRLPDGLGAFIAGLGADVPTTVGTSVTSIASNGDIVLETNRGAVHARAVIVAVSSAVLASGGIRFTPPVDDFLHAASCLPLGLANKAFLSLAVPDAVPAESHLRGSFDRAATGSYYLRPFGLPIIECYFGGAFARALEEAGEMAAASFAIDDLRRLLGAEFARGLSPLAVTRWGHEATILGSYSHAIPGHADARAILARPVSERLCFAGEACSKQDFSTAHGAWQSGIAAADWIDRFLPGNLG